MADGFGADESVIDIAAPQILWPFDIEPLRLGRSDQRLRGQQVQFPTRMQGRVVAATELEPQDLRQPACKGTVGFNFMQGRAFSHGVGNHQLLATYGGHAFPFLSAVV